MKKSILFLAVLCSVPAFMFSQQEPVAKKIQVSKTALEVAAGYAFNSLGDSDMEGSPFASVGVSRRVAKGLRLSLGLAATKKGVEGASGLFLQPELAVSLRSKLPFSVRAGIFASAPINTDNGGESDPVTIKGFDAGVMAGLAIVLGRGEVFTDLHFGAVSVLSVEKNTAIVLRSLGVSSLDAKTQSIRVGARYLF